MVDCRDGFFRITLPYAVFGIVLKEGWVDNAAPIGAWMIGKHMSKIEVWVKSKGGKIEDLNVENNKDQN